MANDERMEIRLSAELKARLPAGSRERSAFVRRALEAALGDEQRPVGSPVVAGDELPKPPASPRAPERAVCPLTPQQLMGRSKGALTLMRARELVERGGWEAYVKE